MEGNMMYVQVDITNFHVDKLSVRDEKLFASVCVGEDKMVEIGFDMIVKLFTTPAQPSNTL